MGFRGGLVGLLKGADFIAWACMREGFGWW